MKKGRNANVDNKKESVCKARPDHELEDKIMNPNIPKNDAEHWARRRIVELEKENKKLKERQCELADMIIQITEKLDNEIKDNKVLMTEMVINMQKLQKENIKLQRIIDKTTKGETNGKKETVH
jgi:hypothetical protein